MTLCKQEETDMADTPNHGEITAKEDAVMEITRRLSEFAQTEVSPNVVRPKIDTLYKVYGVKLFDDMDELYELVGGMLTKPT